jgi:hypothetical protein
LNGLVDKNVQIKNLVQRQKNHEFKVKHISKSTKGYVVQKLGQNYGKINQRITLYPKWKWPSSRPWYNELNFLFILMFNYMKFIDFAIITFKNHMFKVCLYIFIKIKQM